MNIKASAIILSGGKNSRMNYNTKAFLSIDDEKFIERIIRSVNEFDEVIISCNELDKYEEFIDRCTLVEDEIKDIGPIGGIYSTLKRIKNDRAFIVAADMPFISRYLVNSLIRIDFNGDVLLPVVDGKEQPLCAVYKKTCLDKIKFQIENKNYKLKSMLKDLNVTYILVNDERAMTNVNTPEEYRDIIKAQRKNPTIINVVGSGSNVGKTTVIVGLINELRKMGYSISTIKHDVHGFDIDKEGKDTWKHRKAGAETVCISSKNRFAMIKEIEEEIDLDKIISQNNETDFIIVEGYKNSNLRKIEVARKEIGTNIITSKEKLIAVASDFDPKIEEVEWVNIDDYKNLARIAIEEKKRQRGEE